MATPDLPFGLLIEAEELVPYLGHPKVRIVDLTRASVYEQLHIPHAIHVKPQQLLQQKEWLQVIYQMKNNCKH